MVVRVTAVLNFAEPLPLLFKLHISLALLYMFHANGLRPFLN
jgi:hypothetical protein